MKTIIAALTLFASMNAGAATVILQCNTDFAHDQEVKIVREDNGSLTLIELTNTGATVSRPLSLQEYQSAKIKMRTGRYGETGYFFRENGNGAWMYKVTGAVGYAHCARLLVR